jgi:two-component system response regulator MprA
VRILVVDDDRSLRDALRRALTLAGYEVDLAESGQEGLSRIAAGEPDAVVLDVGMPGMDGLELCRRLRDAGNRVPVLMLTARETVEDRIGRSSSRPPRRTAGGSRPRTPPAVAR